MAKRSDIGCGFAVRMMARLKACEKGGTAIEYALIVAGTGLALVFVMPMVSTSLSATFGAVANALI